MSPLTGPLIALLSPWTKDTVETMRSIPRVYPCKLKINALCFLLLLKSEQVRDESLVVSTVGDYKLDRKFSEIEIMGKMWQEFFLSLFCSRNKFFN